ncbi:hypothetical protein NDU88_004798 [Pleurodeles waltl]|uniref:Uncharacterized protein n=1 Tax=Pleurodeles waltl TaxID=8319 RepID=A0AAV7NKL7_PLEWA|nr:hypothetical protein NDU88_004798 [Pleurodeles waltl]
MFLAGPPVVPCVSSGQRRSPTLLLLRCRIVSRGTSARASFLCNRSFTPAPRCAGWLGRTPFCPQGKLKRDCY